MKQTAAFLCFSENGIEIFADWHLLTFWFFFFFLEHSLEFPTWRKSAFLELILPAGMEPGTGGYRSKLGETVLWTSVGKLRLGEVPLCLKSHGHTEADLELGSSGFKWSDEVVKGAKRLGCSLVVDHLLVFSGPGFEWTDGVSRGRGLAGHWRTLVGFLSCGTKRAWYLLISKWILLEG